MLVFHFTCTTSPSILIESSPKILLLNQRIAGTSSRSTKLIWGGSRYLVQALVSLLNFDLRLFRQPISTIRKFMDDFRMVLNCHRERKFLLETQPHLTNWLPIAVPLKNWIMWPPPFGYPPAALGALGLFPLFFKFVSFINI